MIENEVKLLLFSLVTLIAEWQLPAVAVTNSKCYPPIQIYRINHTTVLAAMRNSSIPMEPTGKGDYMSQWHRLSEKAAPMDRPVLAAFYNRNIGILEAVVAIHFSRFTTTDLSGRSFWGSGLTGSGTRFDPEPVFWMPIPPLPRE